MCCKIYLLYYYGVQCVVQYIFYIYYVVHCGVQYIYYIYYGVHCSVQCGRPDVMQAAVAGRSCRRCCSYIGGTQYDSTAIQPRTLTFSAWWWCGTVWSTGAGAKVV